MILRRSQFPERSPNPWLGGFEPATHCAGVGTCHAILPKFVPQLHGDDGGEVLKARLLLSATLQWPRIKTGWRCPEVEDPLDPCLSRKGCEPMSTWRLVVGRRFARITLLAK
jgi:hypothetical protein